MGYVDGETEKNLALSEGYHNKISGRNKQQYFREISYYNISVYPHITTYSRLALIYAEKQ
jgi:hypothetical protein